MSSQSYDKKVSDTKTSFDSLWLLLTVVTFLRAKV
jgi:hypothetical protein